MFPNKRGISLLHVVPLVAGCIIMVSCRSSQADRPPGLPAQGNVSAFSSTAEPQETSIIRVVYPPMNAILPAASTFIVGACPPGSALTLNGEAVRTNTQGYFAQVVPLSIGQNKFLLNIASLGVSREIRVARESLAPIISADSFSIATDTAQPKEERGVAAGDILEFSVKATPQAYVEVQLGKRRIVLRAAAAQVQATRGSRKRRTANSRLNTNVNTGLDAAFGKMYQRRGSSPPDLYLGFYKVAPDDRFDAAKAKFSLFKGGKSMSVTGAGTITAVQQPVLAQTRHDNTIVRMGPGAARTTPLAEGVRLLVDGWQGDQLRCILADGHHVWIAKQDLVYEADSGASGPAPRSVARTINIISDKYGASVVLPLNQRLPYRVEQQLKPNKLVLRVYGVTADIDWVTPLLPPDEERDLIENVIWRQTADQVLEITAQLKGQRQWGYRVDFDDTKLMLRVKRPPTLLSSGQHLKGLSVCIDPGHGGKETGSIGCSGMHEAEINLSIALKLKGLLEQEGARVIMTRISDVDVSLDERCRIATDNQADILLSVHNNALPDGRDPWKEHGTSSYYYHPQAIELARVLKNGVVREMGFPDFGSRWQNLALTRPSAMPSVLVEVGFMIQPDEFAVLSQPAGQAAAAQGLAKGLLEYLNAAL